VGGICTLGEEICELEEDILWVWEEICEQGEDILSAWEEICEQGEEPVGAWVETCAWVEIYALLHDDDGDVCESDDEIRVLEEDICELEEETLLASEEFCGKEENIWAREEMLWVWEGISRLETVESKQPHSYMPGGISLRKRREGRRNESLPYLAT